MRPAFLARSAISRHRHIHPTDDNMSQANGSRTDHFFSNLKAQVPSARFTQLPIPMTPSQRAGMALLDSGFGLARSPTRNNNTALPGLNRRQSPRQPIVWQAPAWLPRRTQAFRLDGHIAERCRLKRFECRGGPPLPRDAKLPRTADIGQRFLIRRPRSITRSDTQPRVLKALLPCACSRGSAHLDSVATASPLAAMRQSGHPRRWSLALRKRSLRPLAFSGPPEIGAQSITDSEPRSALGRRSGAEGVRALGDCRGSSGTERI